MSKTKIKIKPKYTLSFPSEARQWGYSEQHIQDPFQNLAEAFGDLHRSALLITQVNPMLLDDHPLVPINDWHMACQLRGDNWEILKSSLLGRMEFLYAGINCILFGTVYHSKIHHAVLFVNTWNYVVEGLFTLNGDENQINYIFHWDPETLPKS